ncbi:MAG TPA: FKBP-type peptidyl-prolyl cis-trans isomerase [Solirubrobacterales bacterium]|nr:FKBP-type peptidyl-prolyl cis-trans isomerase [Solirubrobacterales bacterium]
MRGALLIIAACFALVVAGCGGGSSSTSSSPPTSSSPSASEEEGGNSSLENGSFAKPQVKVPKGPPPKKLVEREIRKGSGATAKTGDEVTVQYVGVGYESGEQFDASWDRGEPFTFRLGAGEVIPGWDEGIVGMKAGGRRELIIPPELAYGSAGSPPVIGPNETLIFVVDLLEAK